MRSILPFVLGLAAAAPALGSPRPDSIVPRVGDPAPDITGEWSGHPATSLRGLAGRFVFVEFWRTW